MNINRRRILGSLGGATAGVVLAGLAGNAVAAGRDEGMGVTHTPAWVAKKLNPAESARLAYERAWQDGYGPAYGVFYGLVGQLAEKYGAPYAFFPFHMLQAHDARLLEKNVICGELQGAVSAMGLFWDATKRNSMTSQLFNWYKNTALPQYAPAHPHLFSPIPATVAHSALHHISAGKWSHMAGKSLKSQEYRERNARMAADIAFKSAEIMNANIG